MNINRELSNVAKTYLATYRDILDNMILQMTSADLCDSISYNFIVQMIPHHQAAISMSNNILKYTTNIRLEHIACQIISEQTKSIANMRKIMCNCGRLENSCRTIGEYQDSVGKIISEMHKQMKDARADNRIDCNFISEMIPHHMGAVKMSELTLRYDICPELKPILQAIISSQKRGIMQMKALSKQLGCIK